VNSDFFKFPPTPHFVPPPGVDVRGDKVLSETRRAEFLKHELTIEEKIDGANLGISFDSEGTPKVQNRGAYLSLPGTGQWKHLDRWLGSKTDMLFEILFDRYILFGEWSYARHSVFYDHLPDWFLGFDLYDKTEKRFLSSNRRNKKLECTGISQVPVIAKGRFTLEGLEKLLSKSNFSDQPAEGLYLRIESDDWLLQRAKLVRPAFVQSLEQHWFRSGIKPNRRREGGS
jgi:ATP-dependent RNA circularization protein (DNA/RNA ligase family)